MGVTNEEPLSDHWVAGALVSPTGLSIESNWIPGSTRHAINSCWSAFRALRTSASTASVDSCQTHSAHNTDSGHRSAECQPIAANLIARGLLKIVVVILWKYSNTAELWALQWSPSWAEWTEPLDRIVVRWSGRHLRPYHRCSDHNQLCSGSQWWHS